MEKLSPTVTIGIPVYNGENYLEETLQSVLSQTFTDFELIIADNASTDATQAICERYAAQDERIQYKRNPENLGAARNYNILVDQANGKYFKWAAHDDLLAPKFLEACVAILDSQPDVVLAYPRTKAIDSQGNVINEYASKKDAASQAAHRRFYEFVCIPHPCVSVFGLIRTEELRQTRLIGGYTGSDRPLLSELALRGRLYEVPEFLFFYRNHEEQSWQGNGNYHGQQAWYDPSRLNQITFPHWRLFWEHYQSIRRTSIELRDELWCHLHMLIWVRYHWRYLAANLALRTLR